MPPKVRTTLLFIFISIGFFVSLSNFLFRDAVSGNDLRPPPVSLTTTTRSDYPHYPIHAIREELSRPNRHVSSIQDSTSTVSILLPDWEILVIVFPESSLSSDSGDEYWCLFQNNATSPAQPAGSLTFTNRTTFKCVLPKSVRRLRPFFQPILTKSPVILPGKESPEPELIRWSFLAYESFSTESDVVLFVKGVNSRQGTNRSPTELRCVFGNDFTNGIKTAVTISSQEVFRCLHPDEAAFPIGGGDERIKISLEILEENLVVPSVAYYTPARSGAIREGRSLICACTMVYNVATFLREWVVYHSKIGVEKFILYDNGSDDDLESVVEELIQEEYNVRKLLWPWPKTQEAGFSHCAMYARDSCTWMTYIDVDEFVLSPSWLNSSQPSKHMLKSILPKTPLKTSSSSSSAHRRVGQVSIKCYEFGPSNQRSHPANGVTQGYTCRRRVEQRHKSIVLLDAINPSLLNVIHHFELKEDYRVKRLSMVEAVVNHYKYQAWSEFKAKFRRRVSAYVVDWRKAVNPLSKDRAPGLGFVAIEPKGWAEKFCEVKDNRLKAVTQRWFGFDSPSGDKMAWR